MQIAPGTNYDKEGFFDLTCLIEQALLKKEPESLGSKDGLDLFYLKAKDGYEVHYIYLKDGNEYIGALNLDSFAYSKKFGYNIAAVYVCAKYRGRGLGTVLYLGAIHKLGRIQSSYSIGEQAVRTWRSINRYHPLTIYGDDPNGGYNKQVVVNYTWPDNRKFPVIEGYGPMNQGYRYFKMVASA